MLHAVAVVLLGLSSILIEKGGAIEWHASGNVKWGHNCDWHGGDVGSVRGPGNTCGGVCESKCDCTHFTWTNYNGGTCWLKGAGVNTQAKEMRNEQAVCGWVNRPGGRCGGGGGGGGQSGTTTRYWDCCKPSCAWRANVFGGNPVKSCAANGVGGVGENERSSCHNNGDAFACNNQQPFEINGVGYGFAAGRPEWCCKCFQLTFNSGPVNGQTLMVQVTNTGSDVSSNQFDLQIPGGGVGIFNGCQKQWNAPAEGWGARYGGVSSIHQCDSLPGPLKQGCKWRFGWFKGADNPTMTYREVACPSVLTEKTGCNRA